MTELRIIARCALILAGAVACAGASAQSASVVPSAGASAAADRAQKETDRTLYWIRVLAEKPVAKPAAPKPAAPPVAPPAARAAAVASDTRQSERLKMASAATAPGTADAANATGAPIVVAAPPAATAPALSRATGPSGNAAGVSTSAGLDAGVSAPALAAGLAAPTTTPPPLDIAPPEVEEPDPGLIMIKSADPQFPVATMRRLRKGEVEVKFEVGPDGQVDVVSVVRTTNPSLNNAALDAVRQWQFKPTPKGHTALVDLAFNLDS